MIRLQSKTTFNIFDEESIFYRLVDTKTKSYIGKCELSKETWKDGVVYVLWSVKIFEEFQNMGYGNLMLKRVLNRNQNTDIPIFLYVYKSNTIALHLYEKLGFKIVKDCEDAWMMQQKNRKVR